MIVGGQLRLGSVLVGYMRVSRAGRDISREKRTRRRAVESGALPTRHRGGSSRDSDVSCPVEIFRDVSFTVFCTSE